MKAKTEKTRIVCCHGRRRSRQRGPTFAKNGGFTDSHFRQPRQTQTMTLWLAFTATGSSVQLWRARRKNDHCHWHPTAIGTRRQKLSRQTTECRLTTALVNSYRHGRKTGQQCPHLPPTGNLALLPTKHDVVRRHGSGETATTEEVAGNNSLTEIYQCTEKHAENS